MIQFVETTFAYDKSSIFRRLQIKEGTPAWEHADKSFGELVEIARKNMEITACYSIRDNDLALGAGDEVKADCEKLVVAFVSCSRRVMNIILRLMDEGRFMDSYVLNDLVNDVLFKSSEQMNLRIERQLRGEGLSLTAQISPGERGVKMRYQKTLMDALAAEAEIPATLNENFVIDPEKSILYAYGAGSRIEAVPVKHDCANCSFTECFYREEVSKGR